MKLNKLWTAIMVIWFAVLKFTNTSWALLWLVDGTQQYYWPDRIRWNFQGFLTCTMQHLESRFMDTLLLGPLYFGLNENSVSQFFIWPAINVGRFFWPIGDPFTKVSVHCKLKNWKKLYVLSAWLKFFSSELELNDIGKLTAVNSKLIAPNYMYASLCLYNFMPKCSNEWKVR